VNFEEFFSFTPFATILTFFPPYNPREFGAVLPEPSRREFALA